MNDVVQEEHHCISYSSSNNATIPDIQEEFSSAIDRGIINDMAPDIQEECTSKVIIITKISSLSAHVTCQYWHLFEYDFRKTVPSYLVASVKPTSYPNIQQHVHVPGQEGGLYSMRTGIISC